MADVGEVTGRSSLRARLLPALACCCVVAVAVKEGLAALQDALGGRTVDWGPLAPRAWLGKVFGDLTEAQFYAVVPAGIGMLLMAALAHRLAVRRHRLRGFDICYGTGLFRWVLTAALLGLVLSHLLWWWTRTGQWQPTFVAFVSVSPSIVLVYGAGWRVALTAGGLGAVLAAPLAIAAVDLVCRPLGLPNVIGNVTGMWAGAVPAFLICRWLPWMRATEPPVKEPSRAPSSSWLPRRVLADFTEAQFYGNELASLGLLAGLLLTWALDPGLPGYASNLLPQILGAQVLTASLAVWWHADRWRDRGWYPTFVPVVSLAPAAVLAYGGSWPVIVFAAVFGAALGPPLAAAVGARLPSDFHPFIGCVFSMTVTTLAGAGVLRVAELTGLL
ncbi:hypothetical protein [Amycolatopsis sp. CA-230715]|uniref:hypothetical protein n=1 Tax=Amycolatopsis sp. CA-230715 TaxID=2745196 RepID=UPI001C036E8D|nr:hypothetical protein [Amycolatopsis sp. CA-230715]QWF84137.1 hypothetical protein HUW46_07581 [Amycolatopsis sp. CA-230715]